MTLSLSCGLISNCPFVSAGCSERCSSINKKTLTAINPHWAAVKHVTRCYRNPALLQCNHVLGSLHLFQTRFPVLSHTNRRLCAVWTNYDWTQWLLDLFCALLFVTNLPLGASQKEVYLLCFFLSEVLSHPLCENTRKQILSYNSDT